MNNILTLDQVKDILHVHVNTVYNYIKNGKLKAFHIGNSKHWRVYEEDLEAFIQGAEPAHGAAVDFKSKPAQVVDSASTCE